MTATTAATLHGVAAGEHIPAAAPFDPPDLRVRSLAKSYGAVSVLSDINFDVPRGQALALIGANGTGKSTLLRCCARLIEPDRGTVELLAANVTAMGRRDLRRARATLGFVFQRHNLVPRLSVLTNVLHGLQARRSGPRTWLQGLARDEDRDEAMTCLDMVGLAHLAARRVDQLSGGQSQRVAIARALMQRPRLMMADEPVASLDPAAGEEVMELFLDLIRRQGLTLIFTSHHLDHATRYGDRVLGLRDGAVALDVAASCTSAIELRDLFAPQNSEAP